MIKTGQVGNVVLGIGDPSKFNLLGGSFGQSGDMVTARFGRGGRFVAGAARAAGAAGTGGRPSVGSPTPGRPPGYERDWRDRYRRTY